MASMSPMITEKYNKTQDRTFQHSIIAYTTTNQGPAQILWDTDSFPIRVDNCCTRSLSFEINDFIQETLSTVVNKAVSGFVANTTTPITKIGTIKWNLLDDNGNTRQILPPIRIMYQLEQADYCPRNTGHNNNQNYV